MSENIYPLQFETSFYRSANLDLAELSDLELANHYFSYGEAEGRVSNRLLTRDNFASLALDFSSVLEIGPFASPLLSGNGTKYADVLSTEELHAKAESIGISKSLVPHIDFVVGDEKIEIAETFDAVLSSHVIEHSLDFIAHLQQIEKILNVGGAYFLLVPDHRYCFDHFQDPSTLIDFLEAHSQRPTGKGLRSILLDSINTTHNDPLRHWAGDHGYVTEPKIEDISSLYSTYLSSNKTDYYDVHRWYFTPTTFSRSLVQINDLGLTGLILERMYTTRKGANEFWVILQKKKRFSSF